MHRSLFLLLFYCCLLCHVAVSSDALGKSSRHGKQQDPVEVHWYNTKDSLFELHTLAQLRGFAELVNSGVDFHQQEVRLANDIFLNDTTGWAQWEKSPPDGHEQWIPIGQENKPFSGTFDGQGHTIYGLYINRGMESYYQGLFGLVLDGRIRNVQSKASFIKAHDAVGGIAGLIGYTREVRGCTFQGRIIGMGHMVGGIVGTAEEWNRSIACGNWGGIPGHRSVGGLAGSLTRGGRGWTVQGRIIGMGHMVGGIVGKAEEYNRIIDCGNWGDIQGQRRVGGIAGSFMRGAFYNCFNRGEINGRQERVGGIVGALLDGSLYDTRTVEEGYELAKGIAREVDKRRRSVRGLRDTFANNYNAGKISGEDMVGGIAGSFFDFLADVNDTTNRVIIQIPGEAGTEQDLPDLT